MERKHSGHWRDRISPPRKTLSPALSGRDASFLVVSGSNGRNGGEPTQALMRSAKRYGLGAARSRGCEGALR